MVSFGVQVFVFFKQKTAYEMRISDWSSDVCSSDLGVAAAGKATVTATMAPVLAAWVTTGVMTQPLADKASAALDRLSAGPAHPDELQGMLPLVQIGRESCREGVGQ